MICVAPMFVAGDGLYRSEGFAEIQYVKTRPGFDALSWERPTKRLKFPPRLASPSGVEALGRRLHSLPNPAPVVERDLTVVARLEHEVAFPRRKELRDLLVHLAWTLPLSQSSSKPPASTAG